MCVVLGYIFNIIPSDPSQRVHQAGSQEFKYMSSLRPFSFKPPKKLSRSFWPVCMSVGYNHDILIKVSRKDNCDASFPKQGIWNCVKEEKLSWPLPYMELDSLLLVFFHLKKKSYHIVWSNFPLPQLFPDPLHPPNSMPNSFLSLREKQAN